MIVLAHLLLSFIKIGAFTFGGGYAMLPLIEREVIINHHWLSLEQFIDMVAIAEMTPGPIAVNTATFVGYRIGGVPGAAVATTGVVLPAFAIMLIIAGLVARFQGTRWMQRVSKAIRPTVVALIVSAVFSLGRVSVVDRRSLVLALAAFVSSAVFNIHPILVIVIGGVMGMVLW